MARNWRFVSERRAFEREKAGEADRDEGENFGAAGIVGAALGQDVVLQGFVEEQLEAQEWVEFGWSGEAS